MVNIVSSEGNSHVLLFQIVQPKSTIKVLRACYRVLKISITVNGSWAFKNLRTQVARASYGDECREVVEAM